jgi:uncharacterized integral membrane protein
MTEPVPEHEAVVGEGRFRRGLRRTRHTRLYATVIMALAAAAYLILLIVRNSRPVRVDYVFGDAQARLVWLIVVSAFTGWLLGLATSFLIRRRLRRAR